ncbi:DNA-binding helix-turn-helix protein [Providencia rettgeri DSM 1131]|uniref:helix-turn-helix domain-containing protein n=1 Tax=Providencia rettgeri TaxID=587 RepID=UPI000197C81E|nr:helix-turn-helix transcriptional regulator [Providencia rettgeri]EFE51766.1 DNA-binding helix-turn-helix protein [Providencia rettgeri DSM 1131]QXA58878.1 helix-turn-helix domain-containing protein [Providencia rettgeri]
MDTHKMISIYIGRQLKVLRVNENYTLSEFARLLKKSEQQVYRMESGVNKMDIDTMVMYFKLLHVDIPSFFNEVMLELEK